MSKYHTTPEDMCVVEVEIITEERVVIMTGQGEITGYEGYFIVNHANGAISVLSPESFHETYDPCPEE